MLSAELQCVIPGPWRLSKKKKSVSTPVCLAVLCANRAGFPAGPYACLRGGPRLSALKDCADSGFVGCLHSGTGSFFLPWLPRRKTFLMARLILSMHLQVVGASSATAHVLSVILSHGEGRRELGSAVFSLDLSRVAVKRRGVGGWGHTQHACPVGSTWL